MSIGIHTILGDDGDRYMTRAWIGRLRLHIFYRGDADPDCHDHPWDFWTFPLTPYVETAVVFDDEVSRRLLTEMESTSGIKSTYNGDIYARRQVVPAWRWTFRPADHCHRVLGRWNGDGRGHRNAYPGIVPGKIITIVWHSRRKRDWGFLKNRDGKWCWIPWKEYVFGGGKSSPCE